MVTITVLYKKISEVENKLTDTSSLVTASDLNTKISEVEIKIPDHNQYITTQEFNRLTKKYFAARLKQMCIIFQSVTTLLINMT